MRAASKRNSGFTLIELLVVVGIIGVLAAIAVPQFASRQGKAYDARVKQDARNAATAEEAYYTDNASYYSGDCSVLPGAKISPGVVCSATGSGDTFSVQTSHPRATTSCTWTSDGVPNMNCS